MFFGGRISVAASVGYSTGRPACDTRCHPITRHAFAEKHRAAGFDDTFDSPDKRYSSRKVAVSDHSDRYSREVQYHVFVLYSIYTGSAFPLKRADEGARGRRVNPFVLLCVFNVSLIHSVLLKLCSQGLDHPISPRFSPRNIIGPRVV